MAKDDSRKLPDALELDFIICDNTVNRKGWRLLVQGVDLSGFLKNPVCVVQHNTWADSVGRWKNLRVENDQLVGTLEFDRNDNDAIKLYWKYKDGYMSAVSLHIIPVEESEDQSLLLPGQRYATITKSELLEVSLVTVPGQKNAVKLSTPDGQDYKLNYITPNNKTMDDKNKNEVDELKKQLDEQKRLNADNLIEIHKQRGVIQDGEIEPLKSLAYSDYDNTKKALEARVSDASKATEGAVRAEDPEGKQLAETIRQFAQPLNQDHAGSERDKWTYLDWYRKDPDALFAMQESDPEKYKKLEADFSASAEKNSLGSPKEVQ